MTSRPVHKFIYAVERNFWTVKKGVLRGGRGKVGSGLVGRRWGGGGGPGGSASHGRGLVGFSFRWMDGWMEWDGMEIKIEVGIRREVVR